MRYNDPKIVIGCVAASRAYPVGPLVEFQGRSTVDSQGWCAWMVNSLAFVLGIDKSRCYIMAYDHYKGSSQHGKQYSTWSEQ